MQKHLALFSILLLGLMGQGQDSPNAPLKLLQKIPLPGVPGALDHMGVDVQGQRLFIPAEQHQTVEVVDLKAGKRIRTLSEVRWPSTIAYNPHTNEIFVTDRSGRSIKVLSGQTYELVKTIELIAGPDNATYDPATQIFYSISGARWAGLPYTLIAIIDTAKKEHLGNIRVDSTNIQAMAINPGTGPKKMYADLADKNEIAVIDLQKRTVLTTWECKEENSKRVTWRSMRSCRERQPTAHEKGIPKFALRKIRSWRGEYHEETLFDKPDRIGLHAWCGHSGDPT
jgi:hypothetical protein